MQIEWKQLCGNASAITLINALQNLRACPTVSKRISEVSALLKGSRTSFYLTQEQLDTVYGLINGIADDLKIIGAAATIGAIFNAAVQLYVEEAIAAGFQPQV